ncbi:MAG: hypothetical protein KA419_18765 [Acidobacteria bacterium]|nr:hypothetical protein [Acidobacteriota bacterium]
MKKRLAARIGAALFVLCAIVLLTVAKLTKPRILVLHSYATDFSWVVDINTGIQRALDGKYSSVRYHYLDTKRHPDEAFKRRAGLAACELIDDWDPDVVIAVDDNAQEMVARKYIDVPGLSIVFCGVNANPADYGYDRAANVTGILEHVPIAPVKEGLQEVFSPRWTRIRHLSDASETSRFVRQELQGYDWSPFTFDGSVLCETFDDWKKALREAEAAGDLVFVTHYQTVRYGRTGDAIVPPRELVLWTLANSRVPVIGGFGFFVEDGGALAFAVSPFEQGEESARMALDILSGRSRPREIPVRPSRQLVVSAREAVLERYGIRLPVILEAFARATGTYHEIGN